MLAMAEGFRCWHTGVSVYTERGGNECALRRSVCFPQSYSRRTGSLAGTVSDTEGLALSQAAVQATNTATKAVYKTISSDTGGYTLAPLPAGTYELTARVPGMLP